ncbi:unnamed protein product [Polarella glacialis]|uniref:Uncharacterized protein n=1 Tax=Polarella glacialis TaxID=89957 RepID=A0A813KCR4_POLGL|nr:unnamed protein product [Polarella glacialis]
MSVSLRVVPGAHLTSEMPVDSYTRPECRRPRRPDSTERLDPLNGQSPRPSSRGGGLVSEMAIALSPAPTAGGTDRPPTSGGRPSTGGRRALPRTSSVANLDEDGRPTTRRGQGSDDEDGDGKPLQRDAEVMILSGGSPSRGRASSRPGTPGLSNTAVGKMCAGAIAAAFDHAFGETSPGHSAEVDEDADEIEDDDEMEGQPSAAELALLAEAESQEGQDPNLSMSLMSICVARSPSPKKVRAPMSPHAESPSIIALTDDEGEGKEEPLWTSHKPLPKPSRSSRPRTPPRSARKAQKPVLLGIPEPLSARARCDSNGAPLSARLSGRGPRPGNRRGMAGGA